MREKRKHATAAVRGLSRQTRNLSSCHGDAASGRRRPAGQALGEAVRDSWPRSTPPMPDNLGFDNLDYDDLLRWVPAWVMLEQAKLMLSTTTSFPGPSRRPRASLTATSNG
jgi:hypothetical protein